jgi:protease I
VASDYDALVLPGGVANADLLRLDEDAVRIVREHVAAGKPIAAICHGPWLLVEADVVRDKTLTSFRSLRTDIRNAGGTWEDDEVRVCHRQSWTLITSRTPDDLEAFNREAMKAFGLG